MIRKPIEREDIWRWIKGYEGKYKIDLVGNIYSVYAGRKIKNIEDEHTGKSCIVLYGSGRKSRRKLFVHKLFVSTFLGIELNKKYVCKFVDGNSHNICIKNIVIMTKKKNVEDLLLEKAKEKLYNKISLCEGEKCKWIDGFENRYKITNFGRIFSYRFSLKEPGRKLPCELNPTPDSKGYPTVRFNKHGVKKTYRVHKLVAETFLNNSDTSLEVAHLDGDPKNNNVMNLKYVSRKENLSHMISHGTRAFGSKVHTSKLTEEDVLRMRSIYSILIKCYKKSEALKKITKIYSLNRNHVRAIIAREYWKHI